MTATATKKTKATGTNKTATKKAAQTVSAVEKYEKKAEALSEEEKSKLLGEVNWIDEHTAEWTLPWDGKAIYRRLKGRDVREALRRAGDDTDSLSFHLIAIAVKIDGKTITAEDLDELWEEDILSIMVMKGNFTRARSK